ncbi:GGDEF domain-containing protein [Carnobacterium gallinarum]|uniref:GGDEF domain-containing protein n=1 Tax=Carnobacterium gallinarum TaxID=2749 RepID=UPI0005564A7A|nr:diguanylate cyclase [Carnobacterium gallinarum]
MFQILKGVISNLSILISSAYLLSKISKSILNHQSPFLHKILVGSLSGLIGIILMNFSISYYGDFLIDIRLVPIIMVSFSFGGIAPLIASILIGLARLAYGLSPITISICLTYIFVGMSQFFISKWLLRFPERTRLWLTFLTVFTPIIINFVLIATYPNKLFVALSFTFYSIFGVAINYQFFKDLESNKKAFLHYEETSKYDYLTKLYNRYSFDQDLLQLWQAKTAFTIFLLDINNFKQINDTYGHDVGDCVLQEFASCLNQPHLFKNHVYRIGGDEFVIIVPTDLAPSDTLRTKLKIKNSIQQLTIQATSEKSIQLSTSVGASSSKNQYTIDELYRIADQQLYEDKKLK